MKTSCSFRLAPDGDRGLLSVDAHGEHVEIVLDADGCGQLLDTAELAYRRLRGRQYADGLERWDTKQAARYLGLSSKTLSKWRSIGRGPAYIKDTSSGLVAYEPNVVRAWRAANESRRTGTLLGDCRRLS